MEKVFDDALKELGKKKAFILCIEELAELQDAIASMLIGDKDSKHLCEEIADVEIHLQFVRSSLKISNKKISNEMQSDVAYFMLYVSNLSHEELYLMAIKELALLQIMLTKMLRGKTKSKKQIAQSIAQIEQYLREIVRRKEIKTKNLNSWSTKKIKRLKHRTKKHKVF